MVFQGSGRSPAANVDELEDSNARHEALTSYTLRVCSILHSTNSIVASHGSIRQHLGRGPRYLLDCSDLDLVVNDTKLLRHR